MTTYQFIIIYSNELLFGLLPIHQVGQADWSNLQVIYLNYLYIC